MATWNSFSYLCTMALHSFRSIVHWQAASTVIPLLPEATFSPSIQPNLGLPRTRPPLPPSPLFWPHDTHPFFLHIQTISILSDLLYLLTPCLFQLSYRVALWEWEGTSVWWAALYLKLIFRAAALDLQLLLKWRIYCHWGVCRGLCGSPFIFCFYS